MAHPNEDLVREGFAAFGRGDIDALRDQYFAGDISWHFPGRSPVAGDGGTLALELHDVLANDEHAVALYTTRAEREGRRVEDNAVGTFHIHDGKITEIWVQATDLYAVDEFWS
jgi:uncharacterized protein